MNESLIGAARARIYYKELDLFGRSTHVGFAWPLPSGDVPGDWLEVDGRPVLCERGLHAYLAKPGFTGRNRIFECELSGEIVEDAHKAAGQRARLLRELQNDWVATIAELGDRPCTKCGKIHDCYTTPDGGRSWADRDDGHPYRREDCRVTIARLTVALELAAADGHSAAGEVLAVGR